MPIRSRASRQVGMRFRSRIVAVAAGEAGGGDGGIRTLDRPLQAYNGLANRRLQPLGHVSSKADMPDAAASRKRQIWDAVGAGNGAVPHRARAPFFSRGPRRPSCACYGLYSHRQEFTLCLKIADFWWVRGPRGNHKKRRRRHGRRAHIRVWLPKSPVLGHARQ